MRPRLPRAVRQAAASSGAASTSGAEPTHPFTAHLPGSPGPTTTAEGPRIDATEGRQRLRELADLASELWQSKHRTVVGLLVAGLVVIISLNMAGQVRLNAWHGDFFDAIEQKDVAGFGWQLVIFVGIIAVLLALVVAQTWLHEMFKIRVREWLTQHLLDLWLAPMRTYRLGLAGEIGINPDQRLQHDIAQLSELTADLGVGLLHASLQLLSFIGVLWFLSQQVVFVIDGESFTIPGYMVWCALAYAAAGSWLTWIVGRPMIALNAQRYAREAEFRFALVRVSENAETISLSRGENDERRVLDPRVDDVVVAMRRLCFALARLTWITSGYGWIAIVVPALVAAPGYFGGGLSLGDLMMVVGAFNQVQWALRWFVERFPQIADWQASMLRVYALRDALRRLETGGDEVDRIELADHPRDGLELQDLTVRLPDGRPLIRQARLEVEPGERVLIVGESGIGKSTLFRAIGGIWPWGSGRALVPPRAEMMFVPQRPYLPLGTLRAAIAYPGSARGFDDQQIAAAVERVGLTALLPVLDTEERWDRELSLGEQQRVAFARLLLHRPGWAFLDEATSALDEDNERRLLSLFDQDLASTTVVSIGHRPSLEAFHDRILRLQREPDGARLATVRPREG